MNPCLIESPPVRHGRALMVLEINGVPYQVRRCKASLRGGATWQLRKQDGTVYTLSRMHGCLACTCPDQSRRGARCKHIGALQALGFLSRRLKLSRPFLPALAASAKGGRP